jgi:F-type H+-transporting ATPase subunit epsilon
MPGLTLTLVTLEREVLRVEDVDLVVAPGVDGQLGILPRHAPLVTQLEPGTMRLRHASGEAYLSISGGFLQVMDDVVTVLADASEQHHEIDVERAEQARRNAQEEFADARVSHDPMQLERARLAMLRALARLRTVERAGRR